MTPASPIRNCCRTVTRTIVPGLLLTALILPAVPVRSAAELLASPPAVSAESTAASPETPPPVHPKPKPASAAQAAPCTESTVKETPTERRKPLKKRSVRRHKVIRYIGSKKHRPVAKKKHLALAPVVPNSQDPCSGERVTTAQLTDIMTHSKNLTGKNLGGMNLLGMSLRSANLAGACLAGSNLERADLREANLERAILSKADLKLATLLQANLYGARLDGAILDDAIWTDGHICRKGSVGTCLDVFDSPK